MERSGSILLVDDEETFRESTCRMLRRRGFDCQTASDGDSAMQALHNRRFDVMVADIRMPANPELRVVHAAQQLDSQMPVILVTGYPAVETAMRAIDLSVVAYMTKPLDLDDLLAHIKTAIDRSWKLRTLAAVRERLQTCLTDLEMTQSSPPKHGNNELISIGTIRTLACCLSELLKFDATSGLQRNSDYLCELLDCPQIPLHRQAIVETIEVLKKTKDTFRCKELANLRSKLERHLGVASRY